MAIPYEYYPNKEFEVHETASRNSHLQLTTVSIAALRELYFDEETVFEETGEYAAEFGSDMCLIIDFKIEPVKRIVGSFERLNKLQSRLINNQLSSVSETTLRNISTLLIQISSLEFQAADIEMTDSLIVKVKFDGGYLLILNVALENLEGDDVKVNNTSAVFTIKRDRELIVNSYNEIHVIVEGMRKFLTA